MPIRPVVTVDLGKVVENTKTIVEALPGVDIVGVTKVVCGAPEVARAMLAGGAKAIGESRLENAQRLRQSGVSAPIWLLRASVPESAEATVRLADVSLESEISTVEALDRAAARLGKRHAVVAMVDLGDLREGMIPAEVHAFLEHASVLTHVEVVGLGTSLTCFGAIVPDEVNLGALSGLSDAAAKQLGRRLAVSGGSSTSIMPVVGGKSYGGVDNLRVGEAILLGVDPATRQQILGLHTDAIRVSARVIEVKVKPSAPVGTCAQDAFGNAPHFQDRGMRRRAVCALGRQDAVLEGLTPLDQRVEVLGGSSDHLVLDVEALGRPPAVGEALSFTPNYSATLALFTSPYVEKQFLQAGA
jgi:ornithine racemase